MGRCAGQWHQDVTSEWTNSSCCHGEHRNSLWHGGAHVKGFWSSLSTPLLHELQGTACLQHHWRWLQRQSWCTAKEKRSIFQTEKLQAHSRTNRKTIIRLTKCFPTILGEACCPPTRSDIADETAAGETTDHGRAGTIFIEVESTNLLTTQRKNIVSAGLGISVCNNGRFFLDNSFLCFHNDNVFQSCLCSKRSHIQPCDMFCTNRLSSNRCFTTDKRSRRDWCACSDFPLCRSWGRSIAVKLRCWRCSSCWVWRYSRGHVPDWFNVWPRHPQEHQRHEKTRLQVTVLTKFVKLDNERVSSFSDDTLTSKFFASGHLLILLTTLMNKTQALQTSTLVRCLYAIHWFSHVGTSILSTICSLAPKGRCAWDKTSEMHTLTSTVTQQWLFPSRQSQVRFSFKNKQNKWWKFCQFWLFLLHLKTNNFCSLHTGGEQVIPSTPFNRIKFILPTTRQHDHSTRLAILPKRPPPQMVHPIGEEKQQVQNSVMQRGQTKFSFPHDRLHADAGVRALADV